MLPLYVGKGCDVVREVVCPCVRAQLFAECMYMVLAQHTPV